MAQQGGRHQDGKHTMEVPADIWDLAQQFSGQRRPASWIRDTLLWPAAMQFQREHSIAEHEARDTPARTRAAKPDTGHVHQLQRDELCSRCGMLISGGESAVIRTGNDGRKEYIHLDHLRRSSRAQQELF